MATKIYEKKILFLEAIGIVAILVSLYLVIIDYPEFPLKEPKIIPSNKECFVSEDSQDPKERCSLTYVVRIPPEFNGEINLTPENIKIPLRVRDEFYDIPCSSFRDSLRFSCQLSSNISREFFIETLYLTNKTPIRLEQKSLNQFGDLDCFPEKNECVHIMKIEAPFDMGVFSYKVTGPGKNYAKGKKSILIEENGLPYDITISDEEGNYFWRVTIPKGEWRIYTTHILNPNLEN